MKHAIIFAPLLIAGAPTAVTAQSQTDRFDLVCKSTDSGTAELKLSVFIYVNGAEVTNVGISPPIEYKAGAYVNTLTWSDGTYLYEANRFTGILKVTPGTQTFNCEKSGGKKF